MTREEVTDLLEVIIAAYPDTFIKDAAAMVIGWVMEFGEDEADIIYKAARFHIATERKFPTIADIRKAIPRALIQYQQSEAPRITTAEEEAEEFDTGCDICPYNYDCKKEVCIV